MFKYFLDYGLKVTIVKKNRPFFLFVLLLSISLAQGEVRDFGTTRLKSTAGAGVGSLLVEESIILNPASVAFFNLTSVYLQKSDAKSTVLNDENTVENDQMAAIVADSNPNISGALGYTSQTQKDETKKTLYLSAAVPLAKKSAIGMSYRFIKEENSSDATENFAKRKYQDMTIGVTHSILPSLSMGITLEDPLKRNGKPDRVMFGVQYTLMDFISIIGDAGSEYKNISKSPLYRVALQIKAIQDVYLRAGTSQDKGADEKATGVGIAWVQPRLSLELAISNTHLLENIEKNQSDTKIKETSFSLSYRF